jgi:hypothetical protein
MRLVVGWQALKRYGFSAENLMKKMPSLREMASFQQGHSVLAGMAKLSETIGESSR